MFKRYSIVLMDVSCCGGACLVRPGRKREVSPWLSQTASTEEEGKGQCRCYTREKERSFTSVARARCYKSDGCARICEPDKLMNMPTDVERPVVERERLAASLILYKKQKKSIEAYY
jgi:hypothetical protein